MRRACVHSLLILALAGVGWTLQLTEDHFSEIAWDAAAKEAAVLGAWGWIPAAIGCLVLALCLLVCFGAAKGETRALPMLLLGPGLVLVLSALGYATSMRHVMTAFADEQIATQGLRPATEWFTQRAYFLQILLTRGTTWAGLAFMGISLAAGCTNRTRGSRRDLLRWAWPATTAIAAVCAVAVYALGYGEVFDRLVHQPGQPAWSNVSLNLVGLLELESVPHLLLLATAALVIGAAPLPLLGIRPQVEELSQPGSAGLHRARAAAAMALLGAGATLGLAVWLGASADWILWPHVGLGCSGTDTFAMLPKVGGYREWYGYLAARPACPALALTAAVAAAPLLLPSFRNAARWLLPAILVVTGLLAFMGLRATAVPVIEAEFDPHCESACTELDRTAAALVLAPLQTPAQLLGVMEEGFVEENSDLALPSVQSLRLHRSVFVAIRLQIERHQVRIDDVPTDTLDPGARVDAQCDPGLFDETRRVLEREVEAARAVARRNPLIPFTGRYLVVADRTTPSGTLDCLVATALSVGLDDPRLVVAQQGMSAPRELRTLSLHAPTVLTPFEGEAIWTIQLSLSQSVLTAPDGRTWESSSIDELVQTARDTAEEDEYRKNIWIFRSDDLPLQVDLDTRAALTEQHGFRDAMSWPLQPQSATAAIPTQASPTTSP